VILIEKEKMSQGTLKMQQVSASVELWLDT